MCFNVSSYERKVDIAMKRTILVLIACGVLGFSSSASATHKPKYKKRPLNQIEKSELIKELVSKTKKHDRDDDDDDDDDRQPTDPKPPQPQGRPGFVWVGDHWERERAGSPSPGKIVDPVHGTVVVRDHRKPVAGTDSSQASGGVIVTNTPIIRDHRQSTWGTSGASGGVVVTTSPIIRDHRGTTGLPTGNPRPKGNGGGGLLDSIGDAVSGAAHSVGSAIGGAASTVGHGAVHVLGTARNTVGGAASTIEHGAGTVLHKVEDTVGLGGKSDSAPPARVTIVRDHR
jgi:hypothetical protein